MTRRRRVASARCAHCARELPREAFKENPRLLGGLEPWCKECRAEPNGDRAQYVAAYQRLYQAKARADGAGPVVPQWTLQLGTWTLELELSKKTGEFRLLGPSDAEPEMRRVAAELGANPAELRLSGRGGGTGGRRQPLVLVRGKADPGAFARGAQRIGAVPRS